MKETFQDCWFLTGPTASGKTAVGLELAGILNAEIVSLDSMAVYRGMDIGTAKPSPEQRAQVAHHLVDILDPDEEFSLANYVDLAAVGVDNIRQRGKPVLFVGGTPLYLKALLRGIFDGPPADWSFRRAIEHEIENVGAAALHQRLQQVDPLAASKLPVGDVRRIVRALEVYKVTGRPISHWQMQFEEGRPSADCRVFVLGWPKDVLRQRIDQRVHKMFQRGLVDEVRRLREQFEFSRTASQAVGYREVAELLQHAGESDEDVSAADLASTIEKVKTRTRRFAKRQGTWFRGLSECRMIDRTGGEAPSATAHRIAVAGS